MHVPFCRVRCGYCDFNTYTAAELRGAKQSDYAGQAVAEIAHARRVLAASGVPARPAPTVFFGGGTPTLLPGRRPRRACSTPCATPAGSRPAPRSPPRRTPTRSTPTTCARLAAAGFTRVSFGMQSAVPHVLATLERTHDPARVPLVVGWARDAGLDVSLDLIYGTPGESLDDWRRSLEHAIAQQPDHLSAYALIVEDGTKLARQIRRGEVAQPDDDLEADMYELADDLLAAAGYDWYEVSNWATRRRAPLAAQPRLLARRRLVGHRPRRAQPRRRRALVEREAPGRLRRARAGGVSPAAGRETLDAETREVERVLLLTRIREGIDDRVAARRRAPRRRRASSPTGSSTRKPPSPVVLTLTRRGRLLADAVVRRLLRGVSAELSSRT